MSDIDKMFSGGGDDTPPPDAPPAPAADKGEKNEVMLSADHFPQGMAIKEGDKLTFCVTAKPDSSGNVSGYFEGNQPDGADKDSWESDFRKSMSATAPQEEAA